VEAGVEDAEPTGDATAINRELLRVNILKDPLCRVSDWQAGEYRCGWFVEPQNARGSVLGLAEIQEPFL
jgi:hypothetical protein